ncbi:hypothetical protein FH972_000257 [Carpinus fangiana]|uniref:F-box domain-containing protein n=1 Tax=Carpinus fangiana TaxID=176857 RepID=A0A5N6Q8A6_9ROSI|nr:hypothetical protein FH972_000257 [Carpinus fangiana]
METTSVIQNPQRKQQKLNEEEDIDKKSKSLGNLPQEILRHILSFLPTKDAVRISLVSKSCEYLWASIPNLDFNVCRISRDKKRMRTPLFERTLFMNFVDRVLCLRDSSDIKRFTLCCDVLHDASRLHTWISAAIKHNVQELKIDLENFKGEFSLPYCLFTCRTITSLHLCMPCILKLPTAISFSNLQILTIIKVAFSDECLTQKLFNGLSNVEFLRLSSDVVEVRAELLPHLPMFKNLKNLSIDGLPVNLGNEALLKILQRSPCLENLEFFTGIELSSDSEEANRILYPVPSCFLSHLKCIKVNPFPSYLLNWIKVNCNDEVEKMLSAIKILLKKAFVLEEIIIFSVKHRGWNMDKQLKAKACKQLIEFPRVSQNCKIVLEWYDYSAKKECRIVL